MNIFGEFENIHYFLLGASVPLCDFKCAHKGQQRERVRASKGVRARALYLYRYVTHILCFTLIVYIFYILEKKNEDY